MLTFHAFMHLDWGFTGCSWWAGLSYVLACTPPQMPYVCSCPAQISVLELEPALESLLAVSIEVAAFSSSEARPGRPSLAAQCAQQQVRPVQILPCQAFCIELT